MITSYGIEETTRLGITRDIIDLWLTRARNFFNITFEKQEEIIASFLMGEGELVVEFGPKKDRRYCLIYKNGG